MIAEVTPQKKKILTATYTACDSEHISILQ